MGSWGITAFQSDVGLDSLDYIRLTLPQDGKMELGKVIAALKKNAVRFPDVQNAESHTGPMALTEIVIMFLDNNISDLDYDDYWVAKNKKFADITSFSASKESIRWLREYLSDTLKYAKKNAGYHAKHGIKWNGWFNEKNWIDWQQHMTNLIGRLDAVLDSPGDQIEFISHQEQRPGQKMC